jgi:hypothetical protein
MNHAFPVTDLFTLFQSLSVPRFPLLPRSLRGRQALGELKQPHVLKHDAHDLLPLQIIRYRRVSMLFRKSVEGLTESELGYDVKEKIKKQIACINRRTGGGTVSADL